jgi:hypothetical protein
MRLLTLAAVVAFALAALGAFDFIVHIKGSTVIGLIAVGLLCMVAASLQIPQPPARR